MILKKGVVNDGQFNTQKYFPATKIIIKMQILEMIDLIYTKYIIYILLIFNDKTLKILE